MINSFSRFLVEEEKVAYFAFGRMNPPTIGHGKLMDKLASVAGKNPYFLYLSQSNDKKDNPLDYASKVKFIRKMFPKHARQVLINKKVITPFHALSNLYDLGYRKVIMIAGSDRVDEYKIRLNNYNGQKNKHGFYNFKDGVQIVSAGQRDPDSKGAEGASGTKQRKYASDSNFTKFSQGLPKAMSNSDAKSLFNAVRKGMGLKEETVFRNQVQLESISETREKFVSGELFDMGEQVIIKSTGEVGEISFIGSNYVIVETPDRKSRQWIESVEKIEEASATPKWKKSGSDGEIEIKFPTGRRFKIEKQFDSNINHKGEWKVMEWDARSKDWEWHETYRPKGFAKQKAMEMGQYKGKKKVADYSSTFQFESTSWYKDQPEWGTPESDKKARKMTPGEATAKTKSSKHTLKFKQMYGEDAIKMAKSKIDREKASDALKHDRMLDRARLAKTRAKNRETK